MSSKSPQRSCRSEDDEGVDEHDLDDATALVPAACVRDELRELRERGLAVELLVHTEDAEQAGDRPPHE